MNVNRRRVRGIRDQQNRAQPQSSLKIHVCVPEVRPKVHAVSWLNLVSIDARRWWWPSETCCSRCCKRCHAEIARVSDRLGRETRRSQRLLAKSWGCKRVDESASWRQWLVQIERSRSLGKLPLGGLCRQMNVVVLTGSRIQVRNPSFGERWRGRRTSAWNRTRCVSWLRCLYLGHCMLYRRRWRDDIGRLRWSCLLRSWVVCKGRMALHRICQRNTLRSGLRLLPLLVWVSLCLLGICLLDARVRWWWLLVQIHTAHILRQGMFWPHAAGRW